MPRGFDSCCGLISSWKLLKQGVDNFNAIILDQKGRREVSVSIGFSVVDFSRSEPCSIINYQDDVSLTSAIIHYSIEDLTDYRHTYIRYLTVRILG